MDNMPVIGCEGCQRTGGQISCPVHGLTKLTKVEVTHSDTEINFRKCRKCSKSIVKSEYNYCPYCGYYLNLLL